MNKRKVRSEVCLKKANGFEKGNTRQAITEKGGRRRLKGERRMTKNKTTKWAAGRLGPRDQTNKFSKEVAKVWKRIEKV